MLIVGYLPELARAIPLAETSIAPPKTGDDVEFWLCLPPRKIRDALTTFLPAFLEAAIKLETIAPAARDQLAGSCATVADKVAAMWDRTGF